LKAVNKKRLRPPGLLEVTAVHELGHVLGLGHSRRCATMDASLGFHCGLVPNVFYCSLLRPDDVAGAVALYGGHAHRLGRVQYCNYFGPPGPPIGLTASFDSSQGYQFGEVHVQWTAPSGFDYYGTSFTGSGFRTGLTNNIEGYVLNQGDGTCLTADNSHNYEELPEKHGTQVNTIVYPTAAGRWCYTVRTVDQFSHLSAPRYIWVTVTENTQAYAAGRPRPRLKRHGNLRRRSYQL
jgi:hypothetical protein